MASEPVPAPVIGGGTLMCGNCGARFAARGEEPTMIYLCPNYKCRMYRKGLRLTVLAERVDDPEA